MCMYACISTYNIKCYDTCTTLILLLWWHTFLVYVPHKHIQYKYHALYVYIYIYVPLPKTLHKTTAQVQVGVSVIDGVTQQYKTICEMRYYVNYCIYKVS